ncbi:MAG: helix-turn-helix domain-containing protein [Nocardioidaceae bacterium]
MPEVLLAANPLTARTLVEAAVGPVLGQPSLLATLATYLDAGLSSRRTAELLHVHENTVAYRLRRITDLLRLDSPSQLARLDVLMAIRALALIPEQLTPPDTLA